MKAEEGEETIFEVISDMHNPIGTGSSTYIFPTVVDNDVGPDTVKHCQIQQNLDNDTISLERPISKLIFLRRYILNIDSIDKDKKHSHN